jgi:uncharacterized protein with HEPN domain
VRHMVDAAETAIGFAEGRRRADLERDRMLLFALVRAIEILGEAATKVTPETRGETPQVPWSAIVSMRNRLIHGYFDIDADIVWTTVTSELPELLVLLRALLGEEE